MKRIRAVLVTMMLATMPVGLVSAGARSEVDITPNQLHALVQEALYWEGVCGGLMPVATFPNGPDTSAVIVCRTPANGWVPTPERDWWPIYQRIVNTR